jgi:hypothetical protein
MKHHLVSDIYDEQTGGNLTLKYKYRFTGVLGEIVFADIYGLPRPTKAFGAVDGQDNGSDFVCVNSDGVSKNIDIKTMNREKSDIKKNYVHNISKYQVDKTSSLTDIYFCININMDMEKKCYVASILGYFDKKEIGKVGILYRKGAVRKREDGSFLKFHYDTYEIDYTKIKGVDISSKTKLKIHEKSL